MTAFFRAALVSTLLLGVALGLGGCVYRPNIQQGNLLKVEDVEKVTVGMTRSQVRYILGTPMLADPFDPQRWDYIYSFQRGRETKIDRAHFVVHFEGDKVAKVEMLDMPDGATTPVDQKGKKKKKKEAEAAATTPTAPAAPVSEQPQPPSPLPGNTGS